jgi:hypothetical protein
VNPGKVPKVSPRKVVLVAALVSGMMLGFVAPGKAQSNPLPDLTIVKTQYFVVTEPAAFYCEDDPLMKVCWQLTVTNIGLGDAVVLGGSGGAGPVLLRDVMTYRVGDIHGFGSGSGGSWCGGSNEGSTPGEEVNSWFLCDSSIFILPPGEQPGTFATSVTVAPGVESTSIRNCATVDPENVIEESNESNNTSCVVTRVGPATPTSKADCKKGGYKDFGFENQGRCVAYVNRAAKGGQ